MTEALVIIATASGIIAVGVMLIAGSIMSGGGRRG